MNNEDNNQNKGGLKNVSQSAPKAMKTIEKIKKTKVAIAVISAIAPILGWLVLALFLFMAIMMPIIYISEKKDESLDGIDKFINFITLNGWNSSEKRFFETLEKEYNRYDRINNREGELDIPLIAATIHYNTVVDIDSYKITEDDKNESYEYDHTDPEISKSQLRNFYVVANDQLGSAFTLVWGEKKLLGHLIDTKFTTTCVDSTWDEITESGAAVLRDFMSHWKYTVGDTVKNKLSLINAFNIARLIYSYHQEGENYFKSQLSNLYHEAKYDNFISDFIRIIKQSDLTNTCGEGQIPMPVINKFINYDLYKKYLKEVYLPQRSYTECDQCQYNMASKKEKEIILNRMITEIFDQRDAYQHLKGNSDSSDNTYSTYIPGLTSFPVPLNSEGKFRISSKFGMRSHPIYNDYRMHKGIDLPLAHGQPVYSIADGEVIHAGCQAGGCAIGYGKYVLIQHDVDGNGKADYYTLYAHLSVINTVNGAKVGGGQKIGEIGSTGTSTGPHLHLEIQDANKKPIDPEPILNGIIKGDSVFDNKYVYYNQSDYKQAYCPGMNGTISSSGCLPTSYAMIARRLGRAETPVTIANYICNQVRQYRVENSGTSSDFFVDSKVMRDYGIKATPLSNPSVETVISHLRSGKPMIAHLGPGYFTKEGHYVVVDYVDNNDKIFVSDPASRKNRTRWYSKEEFKEKLLGTLRSRQYNMWYFERG